MVLVGPDHAADVRACRPGRSRSARPSSARSRRAARARARRRTPRRRSSRRSSAAAQATSATMCSSSWPVRIGDDARRSRACRGAASRPRRCAADSHGKRAPARPSSRACARAGVEPPQPVLEHRARRRRVGGREEGEDEDVRVPEDVAAVAVAGQAARARRPPRRVRGRAAEVEEREAGRALQRRRRPSMRDVGGLPARGPGRAVLARAAARARPPRATLSPPRPSGRAPDRPRRPRSARAHRTRSAGRVRP